MESHKPTAGVTHFVGAAPQAGTGVAPSIMLAVIPLTESVQTLFIVARDGTGGELSDAAPRETRTFNKLARLATIMMKTPVRNGTWRAD
jgi:hypothetical protein